MTDSFLMRLCCERYDRKPFEQIKSQILTCCVKQQRHRGIFEVRRIAHYNVSDVLSKFIFTLRISKKMHRFFFSASFRIEVLIETIVSEF